MSIPNYIFMIACASFSLVAISRSLFHYYQLESYQLPGYFRTLRRNLLRCITPGIIQCLVIIGVNFIYAQTNWHWQVLWCIGTVFASFATRQMFTIRNAKKPLVYTSRMKRLHVIGFISNCILMVFLAAIFNSPSSAVSSMSHFPLKFAFAVALLHAFLPLVAAFDGIMAVPVEKIISGLYFRDAQRILASRSDLIKIGITGSYGKTSVKFILGTLLEEKYQVLVTPSSFNTPMGVTKIIRTKLQPSHQVFVAEMGARHVGDIKEMCRLVHPKYGVLTSVGPQHLDTFRTIERIAGTKYELMEAVPEDGCCFFADDRAICRELYDKTSKKKRIISSSGDESADVWCKDLTVSENGSSFTLCTKQGEIGCSTRLLGAHNISNILLAASVCIELGMNLRQISHGIARLECVEHRLQLTPSAGGVTTIDDAFNSNPAGAAAAMDVLKQFPGRRIVVTPGMVELGNDEADFNKEFGVEMASACDVAILVGKKHTQPINDGLCQEKFPEENIHVVSSLNEAASLLREICHEGDVVLFENDLPDNYTE